jgi:hypothetical protein
MKVEEHLPLLWRYFFCYITTGVTLYLPKSKGSVAKGQNFGRKAQKGPKKCSGAGKIRGYILTSFIKKRAQKGRKFVMFSFS